MARMNRRDFLKLSGMAGGAILLGIEKEETMAETKSRVALIKTSDRKAGVQLSIKALRINPVKGKAVLIKPNFNTADITPGSTHNDTLVALVEEIWAMGAKTISLGERSYPPTLEVMDQKGILPLMKKLNVQIVNFDDLEKKDWVLIKPNHSHWKEGFRVARPVLEARVPGFHLLPENPSVRGDLYHVLEAPCGCGAHKSPWIYLYERIARFPSSAKNDRRDQPALYSRVGYP